MKVSLKKSINFPNSDKDWDDTAFYKKALERLRKMAESRRKRQKVRDHKFTLGDFVLIKELRVHDAANKICVKLLPLYKGPYEIIEDGTKIDYHVRKKDGGPVRTFNLVNMVPY